MSEDGIKKDIETAVRKIADNSMKENASAANNVGLEVKVTRRYDGVGLDGGRQCQWCLDRCGESMSYQEAVSIGAFQRHPGCGCEIDYITEKGAQRQTDWMTNTWTHVHDDVILETRKEYSPGKDVDFYAGAGNRILLAEYRDWIGESQYQNLMTKAPGEEAKKYIRTAYRKHSIIGDGGTADIRKFEIETGLKLGRNGRTHEQKVNELINLIQNSLKKNVTEEERQYLLSELSKLKGVR